MYNVGNSIKMALTSMNFLKYSPNINFFRSGMHFITEWTCIQFSTSHVMMTKNLDPVKFTTSKAAIVKITDTIGLKEEKNSPSFQKYIVLISLAVFMIYFLVLRKENDIDEILKGNFNYVSPDIELLNLKTKLIYCQKHNLPTAALKAKIEELEENKKLKSPFRM